MARPHVVIIGSGFGGLFAAQALAKADVDITLISKSASHLFQPLLYQVATGILSTGEIAPATRDILKNQANVTVLQAVVTRINIASRVVVGEKLAKTVALKYDHLIVAAGAGQSYFGNEGFATFAPGMKNIDDALELRARIFGALEMAELTESEAERRSLMTFVVVGAGPTGVEMAGQIAELTGHTLRRSFRRIDTTKSRVLLFDGADAVLAPFGPTLSAAAQQGAGALRRRSPAGRAGDRCGRQWARSEVRRRPDRAHRGDLQGVGRRCPGEPAGPDAGRAVRGRHRSGGPGAGEPRPDPAGPPGGLRGG